MQVEEQNAMNLATMVHREGSSMTEDRRWYCSDRTLVVLLVRVTKLKIHRQFSDQRADVPCDHVRASAKGSAGALTAFEVIFRRA